MKKQVNISIQPLFRWNLIVTGNPSLSSNISIQPLFRWNLFVATKKIKNIAKISIQPLFRWNLKA